MMFNNAANRLLEDAMHKEPAWQFFRRQLSLSSTDDGRVILTNIIYGDKGCEGVRIPYEDWTKIRISAEKLNAGSSVRNFLLYNYLKDRGLLKEWFDKARSVGINTKFYMKGNYA
jgi:hypothetical protein